MVQRGNDFVDCWRGEVFGPAVPAVWIHAGPLFHFGLFGPKIATFEGEMAPSLGTVYNFDPPPQEGSEDAYLLIGHRSEYHTCYDLLPGFINKGGQDRSWIHVFDFEAGVCLFGGLDLGFSPGEFLDFLLGWFGVDLAGDDSGPDRAKRFFRPAREPVTPKDTKAPER